MNSPFKPIELTATYLGLQVRPVFLFTTIKSIKILSKSSISILVVNRLGHYNNI